MRITDLLDKRSINLNAAPKTKSEALDMAVELMAKSGKIDDIESYRAKVYAREEESTTGVGEGIAIPHGKCSAVNAPGLAAMVIKDGVDFESLDDEPVKVLFLIAAPDTKDNVHLDVLSKLSVLLMDENFVAKLMKAGSPEEFIEIIDGADEEAKSIDERLEKEDNKPAKILAVTSCPTGIAHTYMAAEALEKKAKELGYSKFMQEPAAIPNDPQEDKTVSLIVSRPDSSTFWTNIIHRLAQELATHNINLLYTYVPSSYTPSYSFPSALTNGTVSGAIILNVYDTKMVELINNTCC